MQPPPLPCPARRGAPWLLAMLLAASTAAFAQPAASRDEALAAQLDLWGEAALKQPNGPSYEFFAPLLPPLRYVNADFRHYPIVLSAPGAPVKARLISNGSGLNLRGGTRSWNDVGTPVIFRVGPDELRFGEFIERVTGPRYADGWLPIVQLDYAHDGARIAQEAFASTEPALAAHGVVLVQFKLAAGEKGAVALQWDTPAPPTVQGQTLRDEQGRVLAWFGTAWKWQRQRLTAPLTETGVATIALATTPMDAATPSPLANGGFVRQREACVKTWSELVGRGMQLSVPEPVVMAAWRSLLVGTHALIRSNRMHYSRQPIRPPLPGRGLRRAARFALVGP
jgi:hypothetical protein